MMTSNRNQFYLELASERSTVKRALIISVVIGSLLTLINHPELFTDFAFSKFRPLQTILTFLVPYLVSSYSSVLANMRLHPGEVSTIDAMLSCRSCNKIDFHAHIGQQLPQCENCGKKTRWKTTSVFSSVSTETDILKSLALFARHNPQPLFRVDSSGIIQGSNPAAAAMFGAKDITGLNIEDLLPLFQMVNLTGVIESEEIREFVIPVNKLYFKLVVKGVAAINTLHIYGNDITSIVLAEMKIKDQAREIGHSIQYASIIQKSMLPGMGLMKRLVNSHFVFYRPRNVVSGDFYWANTIDNFKIVVVADSTGHGVPGAFMSMLGISLLNEIVLREKITNPGMILNLLRERIIQLLSREKDSEALSDGMDMSILVLNNTNNTLAFAGANNPIYICRQGTLLTLEADKMPVGKHSGESPPSFTVKTDVSLPGDRYFMLTDGYRDQFGGEHNKKFTSSAFRNLIVVTEHMPFDELNLIIEQTFINWKKDNDQIDDVLVLGIEV